MKSIRTVMLTRGQDQLCERAIRALLDEMAPFDGELIVVDQGQRSDRPSFVPADSEVDIRVEPIDPGVPYAVAVNAALHGADTDLLLTLDDDAELRPGALASLVGALDADRGAGAVGPMLTLPSGRIDQAGLALPLWLVPMAVGHQARPDDHRFGFPRATFAVSTTCLLMRRSLFAEVGGFHERYHWGFEAADLAICFRKAGKRVIYEPRAECRHEGGATFTRYPEQARTEDNRRTFLERWGVELLRKVGGYLDRLVGEDEMCRFLIYGSGASGRHLANTLEIGGYRVAGFVASNRGDASGYPALTVADVQADREQRILIGTSEVCEAEDQLARHGLLAGAALPILVQ